MNPIQILPLSQRDGRWSGQILGNSDSRMGDVGCLITSMAMMVGVSPVEMNRLLTKAKMIGQQGCDACLNSFNLEKIEKSNPVWISGRYAYEPFPDNEVDTLFDYLQAENPALIEVDGQPSVPGHQMHWVLGVGAFRIGDQKNFIVNDPWLGIQTLLSPTFGQTASRALVRAVVYDGSIVSESSRNEPVTKAIKILRNTLTQPLGTGIKGDQGIALKKRAK